MNNVRLVILMLFCIAGGMQAGYKVALHKEHNRLECNKALVRMSHEKVWSERNSEPPSRLRAKSTRTISLVTIGQVTALEV